MGAIADRVQSVQDRFFDLIAGMTQRDRRLFLGLVAFFLVVFVSVGLWWMRSTLAGVESRIADREEKLHLIRVLAVDQAEAAGKAEEIEEALRANADTDLSSFLEQAAKKAGIEDKLDQVKEKTTATDGVVQEKVYAVKLDKVELSELTTFLYEIETASFPLRVHTFKAKSRKRGENRVLTVDLDIASYKVLEEAEG